MFAQRVAQHRADRAQHRVAGVMAIAVVEPLEMVDVDHQAGERGMVAFRLVHQRFEHGVEMAAVGQAGQRIGHRHFTQRVAQAQIGERQTDILRQHLQILFRPVEMFGIHLAGLFEIEQADAFALRRQRDADGRDGGFAFQMLAGNVDHPAARLVDLAAPQCPAGRGREIIARLFGIEPVAGLQHHVAANVVDIEAAGEVGRDFRGEAAHHLDQIGGAVAALQALGHARQEVAHGAIDIALLLQPLPLQPIFTENTDRLRHVANLVHLREIGRDRGKILRGKAGDDIAQPHDRMQDALLQHEIEDAQEQQGGDAQHDFRHGPPLARAIGRALHCRVGAMIQHILEAADLRRHPVQFAAIFVAEEDGAGGLVVARLRRLDRDILLVGQGVGPLDRLAQRVQLIFVGAGILEMLDPILDGTQRFLLAAIDDQMAGIARNHIAARLFGQAIDILLQGGGQLVETGALGDRGALALFRAGREQHRRARRQGEQDGGPIGPVGDRG